MKSVDHSYRDKDFAMHTSTKKFSCSILETEVIVE